VNQDQDYFRVIWALVEKQFLELRLLGSTNTAVQDFAILDQISHANTSDRCLQMALLICHFVKQNESFRIHTHTW
jgi:hypothetical protein